MSRPRLLFVSPRFLFPMDQGGKIRTGNILRGMKGGAFDITLASPAPQDHVRRGALIELACDRFVSWPEQPASHTRRMLALFSHLPVAAATDRSTAGRAVVRAELARRPDVVVVDFPHTDVLMSPQLDTPSVLFTHNVEAEIFERHAARANGPWRLVWADQSRKMARLEREALQKYDTAIAVSERDKAALQQRYRPRAVEAIDTGVDLDFFTIAPPEAAPDPGKDAGTLVFTATMSWAANVDGIHFLLDEVFPLLLRERPHIQAIIIGRNPPASLSEKVRERGLNVTLTGFVEDIRPHVAQAHVYVIPLFVGSGTRIKAFEAMAMGRPIVSTALGVEGLDVTDGKHFLRADNAEAFARAILTLVDDATLRSQIATAARQLMEQRFSWTRVAQQFEDICLRTMKRATVSHPDRAPYGISQRRSI